MIDEKQFQDWVNSNRLEVWWPSGHGYQRFSLEEIISLFQYKLETGIDPMKQLDVLNFFEELDGHDWKSNFYSQLLNPKDVFATYDLIVNNGRLAFGTKLDLEKVYHSLFDPIPKIRPPKTEAKGFQVKDGFIYIIENNGAYKIGKTINLDNRLKQYYKTENPYEYQVIYSAKVADYSNVEKNLHTDLENKKIRSEWFKLNEESLADVIYKLETLKID